MSSNEKDGHPVRALETFVVSIMFPLIFIVPLHVVSKGQGRDNPQVIRRRILATSIYVPLLSFIPAYLEYCRTCQQGTFRGFMELLGLGSSHVSLSGALSDALQGAMPIIVLFTGSILTLILENSSELRRGNVETWIRDLLSSPLMEEICFRSGLIAYLHLRQWNNNQLLFLSPLFFALSHLHHIYDYIYNRGMSIIYALIVSIVQFSYTYAFGCFGAYLFLRTGSLLSPFIAHMLCNFFGLPRFGNIRYYQNPKCITLGHLFGLLGFIKMVPFSSHPMQQEDKIFCN